MSRIAAKRLGDTKDASVIPELTKALRNPSDEVRLAAVRALGEIGDALAVDSLVELLNAQDLRLAAAAADSLGEIGSTHAVPALIEVLNTCLNPPSPQTPPYGTHHDLSEAVIQALQRIGTPDARRAVKRYHQ